MYVLLSIFLCISLIQGSPLPLLWSYRLLPEYGFLWGRDSFHLYLEKRKRREKMRERNIDVREKHWLVACWTCSDRGLNPQPRHVPWLGIKPVIEHFGSRTIWFSTKVTEKMSQLSNKILVLDSQPDNPFTLIPVWSVTRLSGNKQRRFDFQTNCFLDSFPERIKFENRGSAVFTWIFKHNSTISHLL